MRAVPVSKMHGALNDFVVVDQRPPDIADLRSFARAACDRRAGIGADGTIVLLHSDVADARMRVFNADGSEAEMCGNGMRCAVRYLSERGEGDDLRVETTAGIVAGKVLEKKAAFLVRLELGVPEVQSRSAPFPHAAFVSLGNPHLVLFEPHLDAVDLAATAEPLQGSADFPAGVNVHVAVVHGRHSIGVRHWERGVGMTFACGTGAAACAAAAIVRGFCESPVEVRVPGGSLAVEWDGIHAAFLTGPAVRVFDSEFTWNPTIAG